MIEGMRRPLLHPHCALDSSRAAARYSICGRRRGRALAWIALTRTSAFNGGKGRGEGCSGNPEPLVLDGARVAAEAAPTQKWASVGGNFCPEHPFSMRQGVTMKVASATQSPWLSMTPGSRLKPLLPKNGLLWGGLLPRAPAFDEARGHDEGCSGSPKPLVLGGARVAAEAAPTKKWASVGGTFAPSTRFR
jgi:hypothetical protein